jgi:IS5 family transposase
MRNEDDREPRSSSISSFYQELNGDLFWNLEPVVGAMTEEHRALALVFDVIGIERFSLKVQLRFGRRRVPDGRLLRAFLAKSFYGLFKTRDIIRLLKSDPVLRRLCGFERLKDVPSEPVFSKAFARFAREGIGDKVLEAKVLEHFGNETIFQTSRDSTAVEVRERGRCKPKREQPEKKKRGRRPKGSPPKEIVTTRQENQLVQTWQESLQELPKACDAGAKRNSKGHNQYWIGYKFHLDVADDGTPLSACTTSASVHDSQVAIPLMKMTASRVGTVFYEVMDKAYVGEPIVRASLELGHVPIIPPKSSKNKLAEPLDPARAEHLHRRSVIERTFAWLKDLHGGRIIYLRGWEKVHLHLMLGILCIFAKSVMRA